ncbi:efflux RND transporter periplasmic adaptor subunit [Neptuniibacter halophilus]|uniref:efflux RND transporter periplasmic adaptor subunit n=1 Tax=Neptuniibacter halophilus TaxID=651666 RepID=UPI00257250D0|nr:efflux RND transporter periplasmic adaptor subunit [Neptuniibacter halophilus]
MVKPLDELLQPSSDSAPAEVVNEEHSLLSARISARVEQVLVQVGDQVQQDQPLLKLECRDYELAQQQAEAAVQALQAQLQLARQQLSRAQRLLQQKNASQELRDQRQAELNSLLAQQQGSKAALAEAGLMVQRCTPLAPFAGVITSRQISPGALVAPGTPMLKVLRQGSQEVSAALTREQAAQLRRSPEIWLQLNQQRYPLQLRAILPLLESRARTQQVRLGFSAEPAISGASGRLFWQSGEQRLPIRYVASRQGQLGVMQVVDGKAQFVVLPDAIEGQAARVGLPGDSLIIVEGQHSVIDGASVTLAGEE